ncbi:hypothetical protein HWV07_05750 [Natronomonas salina]|nr:hypothetical protein HWV07_05750 [Natronomonas salina]
MPLAVPLGDGEDADLDGHGLQQRRLDLLAGRPRRQPHLVGQRQRDVVFELVGQHPRGGGVEVRLVLDGDDAVDPVGVAVAPPELDPVAVPPGLDEPPVGGAVDGLADVPPGAAGVGEGLAVVRPRGGRVAGDVQQVRVQPLLAEGRTLLEGRVARLNHYGVPAAPLGSELPGDDGRAVALAGRRPVSLRPRTHPQLEPELLHGRQSGAAGRKPFAVR